MDGDGDAAGGAASTGPLFCSLCFASDHNRFVCHLVLPVAVVVADAALANSDSEEDDDPEELVFEEDFSGEGGLGAAAAGDDFIPLDGDEANLSLPEGEAFLPAPDTNLDALDAEDLEEPVRPDYVDVFMPYVNLRHFDNLSYAFVQPPMPHPDELIL
jgi:hypothetical protein